MSTLPIGTLIGNYTIEQHIASGGMADIYLATNRHDHRTVALKCLRPGNLRDSEYRDMMIDEATLMNRMDHPNVVCADDISGADQGFFTMEYVHGVPLLHMFRRSLSRSGEFPVAVAVSVMLRVAAALHHAHELRDKTGAPRNVIHRDVSMANILISHDGEVKLVDFGVAKSSMREAHTRAGYLKGKISYMSPEQVLGQDIDRRSDVFAMGIVLWELLTATKLFGGKTDYERMQKVADAPIPKPSAIANRVPKRIDAVVCRALERDRSLRYQTAYELIEALAGAAKHDLSTSTAGLAAAMADLFGAAQADKHVSRHQRPSSAAQADDDEPSIIIEYGQTSETNQPSRQRDSAHVPRPPGHARAFANERCSNRDDIAAFFGGAE